MNYPLLVGLGHDDLLEAFEAEEAVPVSWLVQPYGAVVDKHTGVWSEGRFEAADETPVVKGDASCSKGTLTSATLACGCRLTFRTGVEGSPVTVMVERKSDSLPDCQPRLRPAHLTIIARRCGPRRASARTQPDFEEEG